MENANPLKTSTPVYVPFATLLSALESLKPMAFPELESLTNQLWDTQWGLFRDSSC